MSTSNLLTFRVMPKVKTSQEVKSFFGKWFQKEREERGISQKFVADKVDMSVTQLSRIENGQSGTKRDTAIILAQTIGADEEEALKAFYGWSFSESDSELIRLVKNELHNSDTWSSLQKENFLGWLKIMVIGIEAQRFSSFKTETYVVEGKNLKQDLEPISQEELLRQQTLLGSDDIGTIEIDQKQKRKTG